MVTLEELRTRVYVGGNEIGIAGGSHVESNNSVIDVVKLEIEGDTSVQPGSIVQLRQGDGATIVFAGRVNDKVRENVWKLTIFSDAYELNGIKIKNVYESTTPEAIVEDIIDNYTSTLTYASSTASGVTVEKYVANAYANEIINDMLTETGYQLRIDLNNNVYFEPKGSVDNGRTITNGSNAQFGNWTEDKTSLINKVTIVGGVTNQQADQENDVGDGTTTEYTLSQKPAGDVKVTVGGALKTAGVDGSADYEVDAENKKIIFTTAPANLAAITFDYNFQVRVVVSDQDDASVADVGYVIEKELQAPWLTKFSEARRYCAEYLAANSTSKDRCDVTLPYVDWSISAGEKVKLVDGVRNKTATLTAARITRNFKNNQTRIDFGAYPYEVNELLGESQDRIKKLERRTADDSDPAESRVFKHFLKISMKLTYVWEFASPTNSFILGHETLGRFRTDKNFEADCSDSGHNGTWNGTGIDGSQFVVDEEKVTGIIDDDTTYKDAGNTTANWDAASGRISIL